MAATQKGLDNQANLADKKRKGAVRFCPKPRQSFSRFPTLTSTSRPLGTSFATSGTRRVAALYTYASLSMRLLPGIRRGSGGARSARLTACDPTYEPNARVSSWVPMFMLIWFSPSSFIYETPYGGAEKSPAGRSVVRLSTLTQALAFGKRLEAGIGRPGGFSYSVAPPHQSCTPSHARARALARTFLLTFALSRCTRSRTAACGSRLGLGLGWP